MKKSTKTAPKYVTESTFEKHMRSIAKSFTAQAQTLEAHGKMLASHGQVMGLILKELKAMREDNKYTRGISTSVASDVLSHDHKIENLTVRVEKIEKV